VAAAACWTTIAARAISSTWVQLAASMRPAKARLGATHHAAAEVGAVAPTRGRAPCRR
jgi:hypothetical protein